MESVLGVVEVLQGDTVREHGRGGLWHSEHAEPYTRQKQVPDTCSKTNGTVNNNVAKGVEGH